VASVRSVALGFWIDVGSRDERSDRAGVSHFIEHLLFKGSRRFDAQEIAETFDAMGAELNAATSRENTVVYARVPDHHVETALEGYHRTAYTPGIVVVATAGNLEHDRLVALLQRSERRAGAPARAGTRVRRPLARLPGPGLRFQGKETEQYHLCLGATGISRSDRRRFAASLLDAILGGSASSRLFQEIREKRGMAYAVYSFVSQYTDTGQIGVYLGTREDNLDDALAITAEQIADIAAGNLPERELTRAKENLKGRILLSMESTSTRMNRLGKSLITDSELLSVDRIVAEIDAVDAQSVAELAAALLASERLSAACIGPSEERFVEALERITPDLARAA